MRFTRTHVAGAVATLTALVFAAVALAVPTPIDNVTLEAAGGDAEFDAENHNSQCGPDGDGECYFTPVEDGSAFGLSDAFDGGVAIAVNGRPFFSQSDDGNLVGQQLTVGPQRLAGLRVTRIERALPGSPTLRSLIRLQNPKKKAKRRAISIQSDLGSDTGTRVHRTSTGDRFVTDADRWVITADDPLPANLSDPPVTHVLNGKGRTVKPAIPAVIQGIDNFSARFNVRVGPRQTRYLLLFTELSGSLESSVAGARKYNRKRLNNALKAGIKKGVQRKVLNWDLVK